jgi:hypothetical protein
MNSSYFRKGDMTQQDRMIGNYHSPHMVHSWVKPDDVDMKENRRAGNALEKRHR